MQVPNIIEKLSFEEILSRMKEDLLERDPTFSALTESDPTMKNLEVAAWRELLLRQRINEAAQSNLLKFAKGSDLDNLAEFYGVVRKDQEEDKVFRKRIKAKIVGWSTGAVVLKVNRKMKNTENNFYLVNYKQKMLLTHFM